jgi:hypothetical protein
MDSFTEFMLGPWVSFLATVETESQKANNSRKRKEESVCLKECYTKVTIFSNSFLKVFDFDGLVA